MLHHNNLFLELFLTIATIVSIIDPDNGPDMTSSTSNHGLYIFIPVAILVPYLIICKVQHAKGINIATMQTVDVLYIIYGTFSQR